MDNKTNQTKLNQLVIPYSCPKPNQIKSTYTFTSNAQRNVGLLINIRTPNSFNVCIHLGKPYS